MLKRAMQEGRSQLSTCGWQRSGTRENLAAKELNRRLDAQPSTGLNQVSEMKTTPHV